MELVKLYAALLRRKWLVIQSVVFFVVLGIVLALVLPKNYTATLSAVDRFERGGSDLGAEAGHV